MCSSASIFLTWNDYFSILHTKTTTHHFAHSPLALALTSHPLISYLISFYSARITSYYVLLAASVRSSFLVPRFSSLLLGMSVSLMPMHLWLACIHYMYASYAGVSSGQGSASCFHYRTRFLTVLVQLISCFVAPCTYFIPYITLLLCTCTAYF